MTTPEDETFDKLRCDYDSGELFKKHQLPTNQIVYLFVGKTGRYDWARDIDKSDMLTDPQQVWLPIRRAPTHRLAQKVNVEILDGVIRRMWL